MLRPEIVAYLQAKAIELRTLATQLREEDPDLAYRLSSIAGFFEGAARQKKTPDGEADPAEHRGGHFAPDP